MNGEPTGRRSPDKIARRKSHSEDLPVLDGLRAISIACVLAAHLLPLGPKSFGLNEAAGATGMSLFFALSGFLIVRVLHAGSVREFAVKRLARILPLAYLYMIVVFVIYAQSPVSLLAGLGFVLNYHPGLMILPTEHLWSLCVEIHFYLCIAALAIFGRRALLVVWPCCFAITALRLAQGVHISIESHLRLDEILAGACVATLPRFRGAKISCWSQSPAMAHAAWIGAALAWMAASHPSSGFLQYLRPYAAALLLAVTLGLPECRARIILGSRSLRHVAAISYALYVIHPLTAHGWWNSGSLIERYLFKRPASFLITILAAHASTFYWERRWMDIARRWLSRQTVGRVKFDSPVVRSPS